MMHSFSSMTYGTPFEPGANGLLQFNFQFTMPVGHAGANGNAAGLSKSIGELCDDHVVTEGALIEPESKAAAAYDEAYGVYSRYLGALSPLYK